MKTHKLKAKTQFDYKRLSFPKPNSPQDSLHSPVISNLNFNNILCQPIHPAKFPCYFFPCLHEVPALARGSSDNENLDSYVTFTFHYLCNLQEVFLLLPSGTLSRPVRLDRL